MDNSLPPSSAPETSDWSQPKEEDLRGPPILDPQVVEFLSGEKLEDNLDSWKCLPKPSFDNANEWVVWWAEQVVTPTWWPKLASVLGHRDIPQLAQLIWESFQMPQACYTATKGFNDYTVPPTPHCLDPDTYLPMKHTRFGSQDYHLKQPQKALVYTKALQHWANLAKSTLLGKSCQLVECIKELREWMEPFTTFTDAQVFDPVDPSNWVRVNPSKSMETIEPMPPQECSNSRNCRARTRGVGPTRGKGYSRLTVPSTVSTPTVSGQVTGALNIFTQ